MDYFSYQPPGSSVAIQPLTTSVPGTNADLDAFFSEEAVQQPAFAPSVWQQNFNVGTDALHQYYTEPADVDPDAMQSVEATTVHSIAPVSIDEEAESDVPPPAKRGRPRKSRAKKQLTEKEQRMKHEKFLERNRLAASKCRDRRKVHIDAMQANYKRAMDKNRELSTQLLYFKLEVEKLTAVCLEHQAAGCNTEDIRALLSKPDILASIGDGAMDAIRDEAVSPSVTSSDISARHQSLDSNDSGIVLSSKTRRKLTDEFDDEAFINS